MGSEGIHKVKYVPQPDYVQYCNDWMLIQALTWLAFIAVVVIPFLVR